MVFKNFLNCENLILAMVSKAGSRAVTRIFHKGGGLIDTRGGLNFSDDFFRCLSESVGSRILCLSLIHISEPTRPY